MSECDKSSKLGTVSGIDKVGRLGTLSEFDKARIDLLFDIWEAKSRLIGMRRPALWVFAQY